MLINTVSVGFWVKLRFLQLTSSTSSWHHPRSFLALISPCSILISPSILSLSITSLFSQIIWLTTRMTIWPWYCPTEFPVFITFTSHGFAHHVEHAGLILTLALTRVQGQCQERPCRRCCWQPGRVVALHVLHVARLQQPQVVCAVPATCR